MKCLWKKEYTELGRVRVCSTEKENNMIVLKRWFQSATAEQSIGNKPQTVKQKQDKCDEEPSTNWSVILWNFQTTQNWLPVFICTFHCSTVCILLKQVKRGLSVY